MRRGIWTRGIGAIAVLGLAAGCGRARATDDRAVFHEARATTRDLDAALDQVEARLHRGRASVALWDELATRHKGVAELACKNAERHAESMVTLLRRERAQLRQRLAQTAQTGIATDAHVAGYRTAASAAAPPGRNLSP